MPTYQWGAVHGKYSLRIRVKKNKNQPYLNILTLDLITIYLMAFWTPISLRYYPPMADKGQIRVKFRKGIECEMGYTDKRWPHLTCI